jgi:TIGR03009 family protein
MRFAGFTLTALLISTTAAPARQQPAVPGQPPPPPAQPAADGKQLDAHLAQWEQKMRNVKNMRTEITLKRTDNVYRRDREYTGVVLCMKPNFAVLRLDYAADKADYEAYICDGKSVFAYSGKDKTITEYRLPQNQPGMDNVMLDFLAGMSAKDAKERFDITLFKTDENYVYLDIKPLRPADQTEFTHLRLALYGPGPATKDVAYLPAQVFMLKPNGDTEMWKFSKSQTDIPGVAAANFAYVPIKGWDKKEAPRQVPGGGGPRGAVPPPGVRPDAPARP